MVGCSKVGSWKNYLLSLSVHFLTFPFPRHESVLEDRPGRYITQEGHGAGKGRPLRSFLLFFRATDQRVSGVAAAPLGKHPGEGKVAVSGCRFSSVIVCKCEAPAG